MPDFFDMVVEHMVGTIVAVRLEMDNGYKPYQSVKPGGWAVWLSLPAGRVERAVFLDSEGDDVYTRELGQAVLLGDSYQVQAPTAADLLDA